MEDTLLVSRAIAGDLDSFGQLYDRYFPRVYDFSWRLLRDADEASAVTQSVFATALASLPALPKAASFRSWLFTIAHRQAVSRASGLGRDLHTPSAVHEEAFGSFDVPDPCRVENAALVAGDPEIGALVWEAAMALNPRDYGVLDLHVRQGLDSDEIASILAMSRGNAFTLVSRMKAAAADVMTSYVVARRGNKDCEALQQALAPFDFPPYTDDVRRAVDAHTQGCETCRATRKRVPPPLDVFGAFAAVSMPLTLKGDVWRAIASSWHVRRTEATIATGGGAEPPLPGIGEGGLVPAPLAGGRGIDLGGGPGGGAFAATGAADGWDRKRVLWFFGAAGGMLLFAFAIGAVIVMAVGGGGGDAAGVGGTKTPSPTPTATAVVSITPGVAVETATPDLTPSATDTPEATPTQPPATNTAVPATPTRTAAAQKTATPTKAKGTPSPAPKTATPPKSTATVPPTAAH